MRSYLELHRTHYHYLFDNKALDQARFCSDEGVGMEVLLIVLVASKKEKKYLQWSKNLPWNNGLALRTSRSVVLESS